MQRKQNNAARVISRHPMSSRITIILNHSIGFQTKYFVCHATFIAVLQHPMSLTCCRKGHHIPTTLAPGLHSKWCQVCPIKVIIEISFEDILVSTSLQSQAMHICAWLGFVVEGLSQKCINVYWKKKVKYSNHDYLPIFMLLYIMLCIMLVYLLLFAALFNAVCVHIFFSPFILANALCFHALFWIIET